jgi:hypothetical protein
MKLPKIQKKDAGICSSNQGYRSEITTKIYLVLVIFCMIILFYFISSYLSTLPQSTIKHIEVILILVILVLTFGWENWCRHDWVCLGGSATTYRFCVKCHVLQDDGSWLWYTPNSPPSIPDNIKAATKKLKEQHTRKYSLWFYITLLLIFLEICVLLSK